MLHSIIYLLPSNKVLEYFAVLTMSIIFFSKDMPPNLQANNNALTQLTATKNCFPSNSQDSFRMTRAVWCALCK